MECLKLCDYPVSIGLLGLSHRTMQVDRREIIQREFSDSTRWISSIKEAINAEEIAFLSTCNRFEIVYVGPKGPDSIQQFLSDALKYKFNSNETYSLVDENVIRHMFRVASSLDSMVLGEAQILGQMKIAYKSGLKGGGIGRVLHKAFQHSFMIAKRVRSGTGIASKAVSVSYIGVKLAQQIFGSLKGRKVLILGAGDVAQLTAIHLKAGGCDQIYIANRSLVRAEELASTVSGIAIELDGAIDKLSDMDVVVGSLSVDTPFYLKDHLRNSFAGGPLFMIDLGVPRNFDPGIGEIDGVYLYNVDDLSTIAEQNRSLRDQAVSEAEMIIDLGVLEFERWLIRQFRRPIIQSIREDIAQICEDELESLTLSEELKGVLIKRISSRISHYAQDVITSELPEFPLLINKR